VRDSRCACHSRALEEFLLVWWLGASHCVVSPFDSSGRVSRRGLFGVTISGDRGGWLADEPCGGRMACSRRHGVFACDLSVDCGTSVSVGQCRVRPELWRGRFREVEGVGIARMVGYDPVVSMSVTLQLGGQSEVSLAESRMGCWVETVRSSAEMTPR